MRPELSLSNRRHRGHNSFSISRVPAHLVFAVLWWIGFHGRKELARLDGRTSVFTAISQGSLEYVKPVWDRAKVHVVVLLVHKGTYTIQYVKEPRVVYNLQTRLRNKNNQSLSELICTSRYRVGHKAPLWVNLFIKSPLRCFLVNYMRSASALVLASCPIHLDMLAALPTRVPSTFALSLFRLVNGL